MGWKHRKGTHATYCNMAARWFTLMMIDCLISAGWRAAQKCNILCSGMTPWHMIFMVNKGEAERQLEEDSFWQFLCGFESADTWKVMAGCILGRGTNESCTRKTCRSVKQPARLWWQRNRIDLLRNAKRKRTLGVLVAQTPYGSFSCEAWFCLLCGIFEFYCVYIIYICLYNIYHLDYILQFSTCQSIEFI